MASALAAPTRACSNDTKLWLTLLSVVNHSLRSDAAFASVHALQQGLQPAVDGVVPRLRLPEIPLVVALQTRIGRAPVLAGRLGEANRPSLLFSVSAMGRALQVVLMLMAWRQVQGDARMTAHYRLGIGLNNIVSTTEELTAMLDVAEAYVATSETATVRSHHLLAELQLSAERATDILVQVRCIAVSRAAAHAVTCCTRSAKPMSCSTKLCVDRWCFMGKCWDLIIAGESSSMCIRQICWETCSCCGGWLHQQESYGAIPSALCALHIMRHVPWPEPRRRTARRCVVCASMTQLGVCCLSWVAVHTKGQDRESSRWAACTLAPCGRQPWLHGCSQWPAVWRLLRARGPQERKVQRWCQRS